MTSSLGDKIRRLRKEKRLTLDGLAMRTNSSKSYIWELENRNPPRPSAMKIAQIAKALEVEIDYLIDDDAQISEDDAKDIKFYRYYRQLTPETRKKIRDMSKIIGDDKDA